MGSDQYPGPGHRSRYKLYYLLSLAGLVAVLVANFGISYDLLVSPGNAPDVSLKLLYLIMVGGLFLLLSQALLLFKRILPLLGQEREQARRLGKQLKELAVLDPVTRVYNRQMFDTIIHREIEAVRRYGTPLSAIMFDVDDFRAINDKHGYGTGDKLLANLARNVSRRIRGTDFLFRWRGGKFIVLATHTETDKAAALGEKIRGFIDHKLFGGSIHMTVSVGVTRISPDDTMEDFLARIQGALVRAKKQGKNTVVTARET
ncbi:GGDEF domain-containing protein [Pseudodesulfovibrio tunisiensis]|uniref:GGDEF domain-containing protein n=1 Tax=Pseudodesulfovibrio tunisiensis TaxID=463192 RepID=UPI001FB36198|nr:GGDEF domain-containing protein [Pseudodesulfovibrio tunisiensis]